MVLQVPQLQGVMKKSPPPPGGGGGGCMPLAEGVFPASDLHTVPARC